MSIVKRRALLPWLLCALCVASVSMQAARWAMSLEARPTLFDAVERLGWGFAGASVFAVLAALIISRQPRNTVGWLMMIPALFIAAPIPTTIEPQLLSPPASPGVSLTFFAWLLNWSWIGVIFPIVLIPLHFPTGRTPSPRWQAVDYLALFLAITFVVAVTCGTTFRPSMNGMDYSLPNPIGFVSDRTIDLLIGPWIVALLSLVGLAVASLLVRYRSSGREVRQQIKWVLFACLLFSVVYAGNSLEQNLIQGDPSVALRGWMNLLLVLSILTIPAAIAIAILRYQLYDIDLIIRKTAVYAVLTVLLALVYFGTVLLLQTIFGALAGEQSPVIIVTSTLVIAALFAPLRRRVQEVLDRRFFRKKYDPQQVLAQFVQLVRDETDIDELTAVLSRAVQESLQPHTLSLWLSPVGREERGHVQGDQAVEQHA